LSIHLNKFLIKIGSPSKDRLPSGFSLWCLDLFFFLVCHSDWQEQIAVVAVDAAEPDILPEL
jgi:hypothetical protein